MGVAALTSILWRRSFSMRLNRSWKYCRYSSMVPLEVSLLCGVFYDFDFGFDVFA